MKPFTRSSMRVTPMLSWAVDCTRTSCPTATSLPLAGLLMVTVGVPAAEVGVTKAGGCWSWIRLQARLLRRSMIPAPIHR